MEYVIIVRLDNVAWHDVMIALTMEHSIIEQDLIIPVDQTRSPVCISIFITDISDFI